MLELDEATLLSRIRIFPVLVVGTTDWTARRPRWTAGRVVPGSYWRFWARPSLERERRLTLDA